VITGFYRPPGIAVPGRIFLNTEENLPSISLFSGRLAGALRKVMPAEAQENLHQTVTFARPNMGYTPSMMERQEAWTTLGFLVGAFTSIPVKAAVQTLLPGADVVTELLVPAATTLAGGFVGRALAGGPDRQQVAQESPAPLSSGSQVRNEPSLESTRALTQEAALSPLPSPSLSPSRANTRER
jgi:hypothetical protein